MNVWTGPFLGRLLYLRELIDIRSQDPDALLEDVECLRSGFVDLEVVPFLKRLKVVGRYRDVMPEVRLDYLGPVFPSLYHVIDPVLELPDRYQSLL